ncbi:hypothetical protein [Microbacterium testaceum]|uniref:hypothetical protein n=1 Tax=Microbacterium testaceum TaxID=2033 RepID=UPI002AC4FFC0|nr:hypothetical protein [Microbacterium testaceum]MDZ5145107.1 hypothetical protein [Microbacterium testaceum]
MLDRLNPGRVLSGVFAGLRKRSATGQEKADTTARAILFGLPVIVAGCLIWSRVVVHEAELILAAVALLVGALLAGFSQVAGWREKILDRARPVDAVRVRALNEAGALILMSIHVSVLAAVAVFAVAIIDVKDESPEWLRWVVIVLCSVGPAALTYVALSLVFVANLLWDGFVNDEADSQRENLAEFDSGK